MVTLLASFPLANGIAAVSQELVPLGPSGSLTHNSTSVTPEMLLAKTERRRFQGPDQSSGE